MRDLQHLYYFERLLEDANNELVREAKAEGRRKKQSKFRTSHKGGDSAGDPPLPIPNREVKPRYADGTAKVGEQVTATLSRPGGIRQRMPPGLIL